MTGSTGGAPPGWYGTDSGWRWWDGNAWGPLAPPPVPEQESGKGVAILSHLGMLAGGFILPLVIYLTEGKRNSFVREHSREALNFQITFFVIWIGAFIVFFVSFYSASGRGSFLVGFPLLWAVGIFGIVCSVVGATRAGRGQLYRYPVSLRLVRG